MVWGFGGIVAIPALSLLLGARATPRVVLVWFLAAPQCVGRCFGCVGPGSGLPYVGPVYLTIWH